MNNETFENQQEQTTSGQPNTPPTNYNSGQVGNNDPRIHMIDKGFDTLRDGMRHFNESHPDGVKKIVGGTLAAAGIAILMV